jgi:hypothetical protein
VISTLVLLALLVGCSGDGDDSAVVDADGDTWAAGEDCDDTDPAIHPTATEVCDGAAVDEDCNGLADDADPDATGRTITYPDADGDGFGADGQDLGVCEIREGYVSGAGDCDDTDAAIHPGVEEDCASAADENCDGRPGCPG